MKLNKRTLMIGIMSLILTGTIIYFTTTKEETYFNKVELSEELMIKNFTNDSYIDTILNVGLLELGYAPTSVLVKPLTEKNTPKQEENLELHAYIIGNLSGQYIIYIKEMNRRETLSILAHELIHLKQYEDGTLVIDRKNQRMIWKNEFHKFDNVPSYLDREWETEAISKGHELEQKIKHLLY